jgi:hypothetical protein
MNEYFYKKSLEFFEDIIKKNGEKNFQQKLIQLVKNYSFQYIDDDIIKKELF